MNHRIIAVDFDGTLCYSNWPELGEPNMPLIEYLRTQKKSGDKLILWTCRAGEALEKAVSWCRELPAGFMGISMHVTTKMPYTGSTNGRINVTGSAAKWRMIWQLMPRQRI